MLELDDGHPSSSLLLVVHCLPSSSHWLLRKDGVRYPGHLRAQNNAGIVLASPLEASGR